jgi:hypothetical protein
MECGEQNWVMSRWLLNGTGGVACSLEVFQEQMRAIKQI